ncbi:MAG: AMP-dependent synthetase/ligase [Cyanobacteria bacterium P01_A01_bin.37]
MMLLKMLSNLSQTQSLESPHVFVPIESGVLGRTLPSLLEEACDRNPNSTALNDWKSDGWRSRSTEALRTEVEEFALGLLDLGLKQGDRVAMLMHSDGDFCIADLACLLAGLVTVPIDLTQTLENIEFILCETQAVALLISNTHILNRLHDLLDKCANLGVVAIAEVRASSNAGEDKHDTGRRKSRDLSFLSSLNSHHERLRYLTFGQVIASGKSHHIPGWIDQLHGAIAPHDLATIVYVASATQQPRGVMLTHENISANILSAFGSHPTLERGSTEVALSFLPLTHIFARAFFYGHLNYGHSIYLSSSHRIIRDLRTVKPTIFITVPRFLEKVYERLVKAQPGQQNREKTGKMRQIGRSKPKKRSHLQTRIYSWALSLAHRYEIGRTPRGLYEMQLKLADRWVFARWREVFGGRIKSLICGGAALQADIANVFSAAGIPVLQGYGLTETSSVLSYNRGDWNRAGTVGPPIPGVKVAIARDGEILIKAPYVMQGYYNDPDATRCAIDADGWFHTGDFGELSVDGYLTITGVKKGLFKLTTGKYVAALALEQEVERSPLVQHAIAIGANRKFCAMLIAPNLASLNHQMQDLGYTLSSTALVHHPCTVALYQAIVDNANCHLPYWSTVRQFRLLDAPLTPENGMLTPQGLVHRPMVIKTFGYMIDEIYRETRDREARDERVKSDRGDEGEKEARDDSKIQEGWDAQTPPSSPLPLASPSPPACPDIPAATCPTAAQSLMHS